MSKKILTLLLAFSLVLSLSVSAFASSFTDAHGNVIELDDTLEAYNNSASVFPGADNAPESAKPISATCGPMLCAGLQHPAK